MATNSSYSKVLRRICSVVIIAMLGVTLYIWKSKSRESREFGTQKIERIETASVNNGVIDVPLSPTRGSAKRVVAGVNIDSLGQGYAVTVRVQHGDLPILPRQDEIRIIWITQKEYTSLKNSTAADLGTWSANNATRDVALWQSRDTALLVDQAGGHCVISFARGNLFGASVFAVNEGVQELLLQVGERYMKTVRVVSKDGQPRQGVPLTLCKEHLVNPLPLPRPGHAWLTDENGLCSFTYVASEDLLATLGFPYMPRQFGAFARGADVHTITDILMPATGALVVASEVGLLLDDNSHIFIDVQQAEPMPSREAPASERWLVKQGGDERLQWPLSIDPIGLGLQVGVVVHSLDGVFTGSMRGPLAPGERVHMVLVREEAQRTLSGRVLGPDGAPYTAKDITTRAFEYSSLKRNDAKLARAYSARRTDNTGAFSIVIERNKQSDNGVYLQITSKSRGELLEGRCELPGDLWLRGGDVGTIKMYPRQPAIVGTVFVGDSPVPAANVVCNQVASGARNRRLQAITDLHGRFHFDVEGVAAAYELSASKGNLLTAGVTRVESLPTSVALVLAEGRSLELKVELPKTLPTQWIWARVDDLGEAEWRMVQPDVVEEATSFGLGRRLLDADGLSSWQALPRAGPLYLRVGLIGSSMPVHMETLQNESTEMRISVDLRGSVHALRWDVANTGAVALPRVYGYSGADDVAAAAYLEWDGLLLVPTQTANIAVTVARRGAVPALVTGAVETIDLVAAQPVAVATADWPALPTDCCYVVEATPSPSVSRGGVRFYENGVCIAVGPLHRFAGDNVEVGTAAQDTATLLLAAGFPYDWVVMVRTPDSTVPIDSAVVRDWPWNSPQSPLLRPTDVGVERVLSKLQGK